MADTLSKGLIQAPGTSHPRARLDASLLQGLVSAHGAGRFPGALFLTGPRGVGLRALLLDIAQALLCPETVDFAPCGVCPDCRQFVSGHSRLLWVLPNVSEDMAAKIENYGPEAILRDPWTAPSPPASSQIPVGNDDTVPTYPLMLPGVRGLGARLAMSEPRVRVVMLPWAEHLNASSSNALLKLLEEPPARVHFLLAASSPDQVLPTIRSRCVQQAVPPRSTEVVTAFLRERGAPASEAVEAATLSLGRPGVALSLSSPEHVRAREQARAWLSVCADPDPERAIAWIQESDDLSSKDRRPILLLLEAALGELARTATEGGSRPDLERSEQLRVALEAARKAVIQYSKPQMAFTSCYLSLHD